jgi:hypothetical protein
MNQFRLNVFGQPWVSLPVDMRAFCKTKIFVQNQGMREILPQAYD